MDPTNILEIVKGGATTVVSVIALILINNSVKEAKEKRKIDTEEKEYYRQKIDKKDEKIEKITCEFTELIRNDLQEVKNEVRRIADKIK